MSDPIVVDLVELRKVYAYTKRVLEGEIAARRKVHVRSAGSNREPYWRGKVDEATQALENLGKLGRTLSGVHSGKVRLIDSADPAGSEYTPEYRQTEMFESDAPRSREEMGYD